MKHTVTNSDSLFSKPKEPANIYGLPDRMVYYIGVFTFYVLLFFAISYFTQKETVKANEELNVSGTENNK